MENLFKGEEIGAFAMTELGHGSNTKDIETTVTRENEGENKAYFIINSPNQTSAKFFIGNTDICTYCILFAQYIVNKKPKGVRMFLVKLRDNMFNTYEGV